MRSTPRLQTKQISKGSAKKRGTLSRMAKSTKRYGKQTLREILLSKTFHSAFKVMIGVLMVSSVSYGAYALIGSTVQNDVVVSQSEIIARISKHTELPDEAPKAIVRVQDADTIQKQAELFGNAKEGDYIVIYDKLAVVYDLRNDRIVALRSTPK
jgi:hypothetical protein